MGNLAKSTSAPVSTTSWQGAFLTVLGFIAITDLSSGAISNASRHPLDSAEQIDQNRHTVRSSILVHRVFKQHRRAAFGHQAGLDFGHFQVRRYGRGYTHQVARGGQFIHEISERF